MATPSKRKTRRKNRGNIETLRNGSLRVRVYVGTDPITGNRSRKGYACSTSGCSAWARKYEPSPRKLTHKIPTNSGGFLAPQLAATAAEKQTSPTTNSKFGKPTMAN